MNPVPLKALQFLAALAFVFVVMYVAAPNLARQHLRWFSIPADHMDEAIRRLTRVYRISVGVVLLISVVYLVGLWVYVALGQQ